MSEQETFNQLLQFFKVLSNESRLKILGLLANGERSVGELAALLDVREPTVSHHLAMMKKLNLVNAYADGTTRIYSLNAQALDAMNRDIFSQENLATLVGEESENAWDAKVMRTFVENGRFTAIPSQDKKKQVLMRWLVERFEMDRKYAEKEVNEIITPHHDDYAFWRRYMIENGVMARKNGIYWRL